MTSESCPTHRSHPSTVRLRRLTLEERATEGVKAISEYNAAREAERAKTERLRALRLAKRGDGQNEEKAVTRHDLRGIEFVIWAV